MARQATAPVSNARLQGKAREINSLMRDYVNLHYRYLQAEIPDWRERSARRLARVAEVLAELRAMDSRTGLLSGELKDHAFDRARCLEVTGEDVIAARRRGNAAEAAADLAEALRTGDLKAARRLLPELTGYLTTEAWGG
jgi:hypothetical protein